MNGAALDFQTLNTFTAGGDSWCSTFAYWLGVLSDPQADFARQAGQACSTMSGYYDREEQACDESDLRRPPDIIPGIFHPVAPVTLALRWSPFPAAITALGPPVHLDRGPYSQTLAIFRPAEAPFFPAATSDERHFLSLLQHCCRRARRAKRWVLLTGSTGWSYTSTDYIADDPDLQKLMADFGFVFCGRRPTAA